MYSLPRLETERLVLRPLSLADAAAIQQFRFPILILMVRQKNTLTNG